MISVLLVDFYVKAIPTPPKHSWNVFLFTCICPFLYVASCKGSKCGCTLTEMIVNTLHKPNRARRESQPHITSFTVVWFMRSAQMASV